MRQPGVAATEISDVILGNATGGGGNVARLAALTAGLPEHIPGMTVDRQCGSGLEAIVLACRLIQAGAGELYLAGGVESISTAPARAHRGPNGELEFFDRAQFAPYESGDPDAGVAAENVASHYQITRQRQDAYAMESHRRAVAAAHNGHFDEELVPLAALTAGKVREPRSLPDSWRDSLPPLCPGEQSRPAIPAPIATGRPSSPSRRSPALGR
ncbi:thiolase family protein [Arthrobacter psychrolactophilus]